MSLGKKDIAKNISSKAQISYKNSYSLLESFISLIKNNKNNNIKIPKFGVFYTHISPPRIGRNPGTKEEFKIPSITKLAFRASKEAKNTYN